MPPPPPQQRGGQEPTIWQKITVKMGAMMGAGVGLTIGFIFGSYSIIRGGAGPRGFLATLSQYMLGSAASFSFFLAIGSVIRTEDHIPLTMQAAALYMLPPKIANRPEGVALATTRARWMMEKHKERRTPN